ncbi:peptidoglycan-binding protein [Rhizobium sp. CRIBSB]|nr:peptidoglycan-binding protein [Rhizobium sp. CRIBSB]
MTAARVKTDSDAVRKARRLLAEPEPVAASHWSLLGAAAMAAMAAVLMAGVMILGPGVEFTDPTISEPLR